MSDGRLALPACGRRRVGRHDKRRREDYHHGHRPAASVQKAALMKRNLLRRIEALESKSTDESRLVPHSPGWLAYWDRELYNYFTGQPHVPLIFAGVRAVLQVWGDPGFLVSTLPNEDEDEVAA